MQSSHAHSVLLRDLISRQNEQARTLEEIRLYTSTSSDTSSSAVSTRLPSAGTSLPDNRDNSNNASIISKRSTLSLRLGRPTYIEDLKASRAYKRLRHFGLGIGSSAESVFTFDSNCSAGNWSMLSDITLGDLSVSQIAVLNLPIDRADVYNPKSFQEPSSTETHRSRPKPRLKWSSRGRMHNAIGNGNEFVVRTLIGMGVDAEELDSKGRTPLVHAAMEYQEAICKFLLEKGASIDALKAFTSGMDVDERSKLLDPLIHKVMDDGSKSITTLRPLVLMALGINDGGDNNLSSGQSIMHAAIDLSYELAVCAIIQFEPRVLVEVDINGRTPLVYAAMECREAMCKLLLEKGASVDALKAFTRRMDVNKRSKLLEPLICKAMDGGSRSVTVLRLLVLMALGTNYRGGGDDNLSSSRSMMHAAIDLSYDLAVCAIIQLEPQVLVEVDINGRTPLVHAAMECREAMCKLLLEKGARVDALKAFTSGMDVDKRSKLLEPLIRKAMDDGRLTTVLGPLVQMALGINDGGDNNLSSGQPMMHAAIDLSYELAVCAIIQFEPRVLVEVDINGRTPLVYAAMECREAMCKLLLEKGASVDALKAFTSGMDVGERSKLLDPLICKAMDDGSKSLTVLRLLVLMAVGINDGDSNLSLSQSIMNAGIDKWGTEAATEVVMLGGDLPERGYAVTEGKSLQLLRLLALPGVDVGKITIEGQVLLAYAAEVVLNSKAITYRLWPWDYICRVLLDKTSRANIETVQMIRSMPEDRRRIATSMQELVEKDYKSLLVLLSLIGSRDAEGWTPLALAAFNNNEALCEFLVEKGCSLCLSAEQKKQLKSKLGKCIHTATQDGHKTALRLLLDMGADINEKDELGRAALLNAVICNHLSCVKILTERGADTTISEKNNQCTVLHCAALYISEQIMQFLLEDVETRKLIDVVDSYGDTALHNSTCVRGIKGLEIAKMLVQAGATLTIKNMWRETPYEKARYWCHKNTARYLWSQLSPEQQAQEIPLPSDW